MEVNDHVIILVIRGMCSAAGLGCVWITLRLGVTVFHRTEGLFLLPIIALSAVMPSDVGYFGLDSWAERLKDRRVLYSLLAIPVVFAVAFAMTNPYALIHSDLSEARLQSEKDILSFGFRVIPARTPDVRNDESDG